MCQILAYMIYKSLKLVFILFNSCPRPIITSVLRLNFKLRKLARFFFNILKKFYCSSCKYFFFPMLTKVKHCHIISNQHFFSSKRCVQFIQFLIVKTLSLLSIETLVYPNLALKTLRQLSHHCCANAEVVVVVSFSCLT